MCERKFKYVPHRGKIQSGFLLLQILGSKTDFQNDQEKFL